MEHDRIVACVKRYIGFFQPYEIEEVTDTHLICNYDDDLVFVYWRFNSLEDSADAPFHYDADEVLGQFEEDLLEYWVNQEQVNIRCQCDLVVICCFADDRALIKHVINVGGA